MTARDVKYAVVTTAFVADPEVESLAGACYLIVWPSGRVELEVDGRKGVGASKLSYRYRQVREANSSQDLAGEALAIVLDAARPEYKAGDYETLAVWGRARVHRCEHGHYPPDCSKCVLLYDPEESNGD